MQNDPCCGLHLKRNHSGGVLFFGGSSAACCGLTGIHDDQWGSVRRHSRRTYRDWERCRFTQIHPAQQKGATYLRLVWLSSEQLNQFEGTRRQVCCIFASTDCWCELFPCYSPPVTLHCGWPCEKTLEGIFGHIVRPNYTLRLSNCCVILSLHSAAQLSCPAVIGFFTRCLTVCLTAVLDLKACCVVMVFSDLLNIFLGLVFILILNLGCKCQWIWVNFIKIFQIVSLHLQMSFFVWPTTKKILTLQLK